MPFKSEAQRKYLWANEPEIARDWTDKHGSGAAHGGRIPFAEAGAVGKDTLTSSQISDLQSMVQTYPGTKIGDEAQRKLDINAGKAVEDKKEVGFFEKLLGFGEAQGAETGSTAEDQMRKEFFDYGTQQADVGDTAYSNLKVPGLNVQHPEGLSSIGPHGFEYGNQWQTAKENEDDTQSWWTNLLKQAAGSQIGKKLGWVGGLPGIMASGLTGGMGNIRDRLRTVDGTIQPQSYWSESARQQRQNQARVNNLIANYIAGKNKMTPLGLRNRINQLGTQDQINTFNTVQTQAPIQQRAQIVDDWSGGSISNGGNTSTSTQDDWGDMSYMIARGGLAQRAPRGSYLNGGLASLWPR